MKSQIVILDFGSQYTHLITRRIRQLGVLSKIYSPDIDIKLLRDVKGIILSGGPQSVHDKTAIQYNRRIFALNIPILGLCYGHQLIAHNFGGDIKAGRIREYGFANLKKVKNNPLFTGLKNKEKVWMSHGDTISRLPNGFEIICSTDNCKAAAIVNSKKNIYGLQFHPEVTHTEHGMIILKNFVFNICKSEKNWSMEKHWKQLVQDIKKKVGNKNVFLLVSGGVDSSVCFALLEKILGKRKVFGLHIDNGFMRMNESKKVKESLAKAGFNDLYIVNASDKFLKAEKGIINSEQKRKIIGKTFLEVKDEVMKRQGMNSKDWILAQGTIYPDIIESGATKNADRIKTHHNRVEQVLKLMKLGALVEPLAELYKDEVRQIGKRLKLPSSIISRYPFPGPGLAIRTLCSDGKGKVKNEGLLNNRLHKIISKKLKAKVLPLRSVGVQGDVRTYRNPVLIYGSADWKTLNDLSIEITNQFSKINRVVYLVYPKKINLNKLEIKQAYLTKYRLDLLRKVDDIITKKIKKYKIYKDIWQFPIILAPLSLGKGEFSKKLGESIILRPIQSKEAMTVNFYKMQKFILNSIIKKISKIPSIDLILYDITNKPPGTIEWE